MTSERTNDPHDLARFLKAQETTYATALAELKSAKKRSHWMWFIFPQIDGLGHSPTARFYAIKSLDEARQYLEHPVLGARLVECSTVVAGIKNYAIEDIFGFPDYLKFRSSMTLFSRVENAPEVFQLALDRFFDGEPDGRTLELVNAIHVPY